MTVPLSRPPQAAPAIAVLRPEQAMREPIEFDGAVVAGLCRRYGDGAQRRIAAILHGVGDRSRRLGAVLDGPESSGSWGPPWLDPRRAAAAVPAAPTAPSASAEPVASAGHVGSSGPAASPELADIAADRPSRNGPTMPGRAIVDALPEPGAVSGRESDAAPSAGGGLPGSGGSGGSGNAPDAAADPLARPVPADAASGDGPPDPTLAEIGRLALDLNRLATAVGMTTVAEVSVAVLDRVAAEDRTAAMACAARLRRLSDPRALRAWDVVPDTSA